MRTRVKKWGNSLAVRIPKPLAVEAGLGENSAIDMSVVEGRVLIEPAAEHTYALAEMLAGFTEENLHREVESRPPAGNEAWNA